MSRRNRSRAAFSLFSFQDIITAVTAIVILLVLILTLELITRRQQVAAADPAIGREALEATIAEFEALVARLSAAAPGGTIRPLATRTRAELEHDARTLRDQAERAAERAAATRVEEQRARDLATAEAARLEAAIADGAEAAREAARAADLEAEARQLTLENEQQAAALEAKQQEVEADPVAGAAIVFNDAREFGRQAWILELADGKAAAVKLGTGRRQDLGAGTGPGTPLASWLAGLDDERDHALVLVRPSGVEEVEDVLDALADAGIPFGLDLIGEQQVVRDGKAEAGAGGGGG